MKNKNCLIFQPIGLGDIIWVQPIVNKYIEDGYTVYYPVNDFYFELVKEYIKTDGLIWVRESDDFPMRKYLGHELAAKEGEDIYIPLTYSDCYARTGPMIAKYFYTNTPAGDWRKGFEIKRKLDKEKELIDKYELHGDYIIVNNYYHQPPNSNYKEIVIESDVPIKRMSYTEDKSNGFTLFDWISALENAKQVHTVGTSVSYLVDKYCIDNEIYCYERRMQGQDRTYHEEIHLVHRNPNWIYMD
jgi:hypothetical protein